MLLILLGAVLVLAGLILLLVWILWAQEDSNGSPTRGKAGSGRPDAKQDLPRKAKEDAGWHETEELMGLCRTFLAATTEEAILAHIRDAVPLAPAASGHSAAGMIEADPLCGLNGRVDRCADGGHADSVHLASKPSGNCTIHVCKDGDALRLDGGRWIGLPAMPWEEIIGKRPIEPVLVRALLSQVEHTHMGFSDGNKWHSIRIGSPERLHVPCAHVGVRCVDDQQVSRMAPASEAETFPITLMILYPEEPKRPIRSSSTASLQAIG